MTTILKISKITNIIALIFLLLGPYGLAITGTLQLFAAFLFLLVNPKNKFIYIYFGIAISFFILCDFNSINWLFAIPLFLILFLTYIIHFQKN